MKFIPLIDEEREVKPIGCRCNACRAIRREARVPESHVRAYSYTPPNGWALKDVPGQRAGYYLGIELETDSHSSSPADRHTVYADLSNGQGVSLRRPRDLWIAKHDGSISGPEFCSHPASMEYWTQHRNEIALMMRLLIHAGFRSHDNDRCGMHINISRSAFGDEYHLYNFLTLLHTRPAWSVAMSQRTLESANSWASFGPCNSWRDRSEFVRSMFNTRYDRHPGGHARYSVLNAPYGEPRFEFRLPRGTLRVDRFYKNLQWTVGMIEYTRNMGGYIGGNPVADFTAWAVANEAAYPDLVSFMKERLPLEWRPGNIG